MRAHAIPSRSTSLLILVALLFLIFFVDLVTPVGVAIGVLYATPMLAAVLLLERDKDLVPMLAACLLLTVAGYFLSPPGEPYFALANRLLAIVVILTIFYLGSRMRASMAKVAASQRREALAKRQLEAVMEQMPAGLLIMGGDSDRSVKGNRALDAINRATLDAADPLGSLLSMRPARPDGTPYGRDDLPVARSFDRGERVANEEVVITHSDGEQSILSVNSGPVMGDDGTIFAAVMTVSDITGRVRREGQLRTLTRDLTRSNEELQQFAYIASHDLQEPLRMVISYLGLLEKRYDDKLDESGRTFIFYAVDGAKRMQVLINDILAFSRVESRAAPFVDTDLNQALQEAISTLEASLREYGGSVTAEHLPTVRADRAQMAQLLRNLIGNALKFHGPEPPVVKVYAESSPSEWTVTVEDNGIGMAPEYHDKIFRMFERLNRQEDYPGTGIGLAICKKIVERHGGRIWAESEPGKGSKFRFTIPVKNENER